MTFPRRDEIYLVAFDPTIDHEIRKTRPALIIENDISNEHSLVAVISLQFGSPPRPREVLVLAGARTSKPSAVILNQVRSIDRLRLQNRLGMLDAATTRRVDEAIKINLGLVPP